jgi:hypothetical protein
MGVTDPDALVKAPPSFEVPVKPPIAGLVVEQDVAAEVYNLNLATAVRTLWVRFSPVEKADFDTCKDWVSQLSVNGPSTSVILKLLRNV